jgi:hypothetical protein
VGGIAELPEQNVNLGRGPSTAEVICVAIGSSQLIVSQVVAVLLTQTDSEIFLGERTPSQEVHLVASSLGCS